MESDGRRLALRDPNHDLQELTIDFPTKSGIGRQVPVGDPVIEAEPIAGPMLALTDGEADTREGRLPALITTRYWEHPWAPVPGPHPAAGRLAAA